MLAFWPLVRTDPDAPPSTGDPSPPRAGVRPAAPVPPAAAASCLGDRGRLLRNPDRRSRVPFGAQRAARPAAPGVRLVARDDRVRGLAQPAVVRPDLAVRGRADGQ